MQKTKIKFGTDGFRGIIAKDFTFETVEKLIKAVILYIRSLKTEKNTIIIGYDSRFMAADFAEFAANIFKDCGFNAVLSSKVIPTPVAAYYAKYCPDSSGAVMFTASHNPKEYQGIKFIPPYAGPASKEITDKILEYLNDDITPKKGGKITKVLLEDEYIKHLENIVNFDLIGKNQPKIIYDGLYSASVGYFDKILDKHGIIYKSFNMHHSSDFGGGLPEPKPEFMKHKENGYITVANDGDGDRFGVLDENGNYVSPNIVIAMLLKYFIDSKKTDKTGYLIKTAGVSNIVDVVAKKLNVKTITTPVGFKWLSQKMRENKTIIAAEDSGGLSIQGHIPEKDGILANLLIIEMMSYKNKSLNSLVKEIIDFAGCEFFCDRVDIKLNDDIKIENLMNKFNGFDKISSFSVKDKLLIDGIKLFLDDGLTSLLIRKSGTEPLLRFYIESDKIEKTNEIKDFIKKISAIKHSS